MPDLLFWPILIGTLITLIFAVTETINLFKNRGYDQLPYAATSIFFSLLTAIGISLLL